ncbi:methylmalonyl Co-A mutase-associated GTPase MeaB [Arenibacter sp. M-2]|uniref:methylmalonyl Co-A mutase-associated GTPase MeaB n=1 Tax=unclassified Arenibacter TaxID=2615047 RepID=UPI000D75FD86|nr:MULTISPECIES: methylmalonyl Co-A mutase-associated GTPase MeaB [unclassified Arenibacter]MDL5514540.1 methylmalonyl Co-A mutase-associated GTPase MeaB [Arenibacter sp. M-2]PXX28242.1 methylmalonyl-CoA mutase metallochaperone MeaB [Arenibacter sp. ARW7G5Y1]
MITNKNTDGNSNSKNKTFRKKSPSTADLVQGILNGDIATLARAITLVESTNIAHFQKADDIINQCLPHSGKSIRIGITGVPGVGKSTFIETFGTHLTALGKKVAVLAVDPTSTISKGSILGDKTRMQELVKDRNAYIRPSPTGYSLGGVARKTRETIILCEAAGFDTILVETVGVGQSETAVHGMVDFFLLLKLAGAGDELQGIKRGIMEMADAIVINKADGKNIEQANLAKVEFSKALHLYPPKENGWTPKILSCSAIQKKGITEIWEVIKAYIDDKPGLDGILEKRKIQNKYWLLQTIEDRLKQQFYENKNIKNHLEQMIKLVVDGKISPFNAAEKLLRLSKEPNS